MMEQGKKGFFRGLMDKIGGAAEQAEETAVETAVETGLPLRQTAVPVQEKPKGEPGFFERLKLGLKKTKDGLVGRIDSLVLGKKEIDAETLEELEEILITSDIGVKTTLELIRTLEQRLGRNELKDGDNVTLIKDLKVKGANLTLKRGTMIKGIRLTGNVDEVDCRHEKVKGLVLRTEFLKKA